METKFTPGPWLHRAKSESVHMTPPEPPCIYGEIIFAFSEYSAPNDADLALIISAPDLYAALEELLYARTDKSEAMAAAALAKARG